MEKVISFEWLEILFLLIVFSFDEISSKKHNKSNCFPYLENRVKSIINLYSFYILKMDYLYCPCPTQGCLNKKVNFWYHSDCGSRTMIRYSDIFIVCSGCKVSSIMFGWQFSCEAHGFRDSSMQGWLYALSILGSHQGN